MKKASKLFLIVLILLSLASCGNPSENEASKNAENDQTKNAASDASKDTMQSNNTEEQTEDYYLTYVLGKRNVNGEETVFLTDERDMENWQVPVKGAVPGDGHEAEQIRFLGIDWKGDGTIDEVNMSDFLNVNTFGSLETPGTSGKLNVNNYGANPENGTSSYSEWKIEVNGTEVILTDEDGTIYYFYEDHFEE